MKAYKFIFVRLFLLSLVIILSCNSNNNSGTLRLSGKWLMSVTENDIQNNKENSELKKDTSFNSLFRGLKLIPDNSEWNFVNDSILIVSKSNDNIYKPDTVVYKVSQFGDTLVIVSKDMVEKYAIKKMDYNRIELDFGDKTVSYQLKKKP